MNKIEKDFNTFHKILQDELQRKQTMTINEFKSYEPLFNQDQKSEQLTELANEFFKRIDPYSPISIVDNISNEEIIRLPPIFFPLQAINNDNKDSINKFYSLIQSDLPRLKSEGIQHYIKAFAKSQISKENKALVTQYKDTFSSCYDKLREKYSTKDKVEIDQDIAQNIEISEIDGIDWD